MAEIPEENLTGLTPDEDHSNNSEKQPNNAAPPNTPERRIPPPIGNTNTAKNKHKDSLKWGEFVMEVLTLIVISTYTIIAYHQWEEMREATKASKVSADAAINAAKTAQDALTISNNSAESTLTEMKKQSRAMQDAAKASQISSYAAREGSKIARDSFILTRELEQPIVAIESITQQDFPDGKVPYLAVNFHNYGRSPAVNVLANVTFHTGELNDRFIFDDKGTFQWDILPSYVTKPRGLPTNEKWREIGEQVKNKKIRFYIIGFLEYRDTQGRRFPRKEFCLVYTPSTGRPASFSDFNFCETHNQ